MSLLNVPHLGMLQFQAMTGETLLLATCDRLIDPDGINGDKSVTINNVEYTFRATARSLKDWERFGKEGRGYMPTQVVWTTNGQWGIRPYDVTGSRVHRSSRWNQNLTDSALSKLTKRLVLFLDGYMETSPARMAMIEAAQSVRQDEIGQAQREIARLKNLLDTQSRKLSDLMDASVGDLLDLSRALDRGDDIHPLFDPPTEV